VNLKAQRAAALKAAQDIVAKAQAESRALTADEQAEVQAKTAEIADLDAKIKSAADSDALMSRLASLGGGKVEDEKDGDQPQAAKSLGEHFAKSVGAEGLARLKSVRGTSLSTTEFKANTDPQLTPSAFSPVLTQVDRTVVQGFRRASIADLLGTGTLGGNSNAVTYFVEGAAEGNFATVAEGGQKPQLHIADPTSRTDSLKKIAGWWDTSDEMIEDLDFWVSEINNRGLYLLSMVEESQLLNGDGTGTNVLGLLNRSGIQTETQAATGDSAQDAIFRAMTKVQTATGLTADSIVINPADYQALRLSKDSNGQYYGGGFFAGQYGVGGVEFQPPLWGLRTVVSSAVAAKTVVVGALQAASTVYRKGGVRVESTNSDGSKFTKDIVTTRIEERIALAVRVPAAVVKVTLV
jgi:HK97 family phage major capsid protein